MKAPQSTPAALHAQLFATIESIATGNTPGSIAGISEEEFEAAYALGHAHYGQARYDDAAHIFKLLVMHDPLEPRFALALGSTHQALGKWQNAIQLYTMATLLDIDDPKPTFHTGECLVRLGFTQEAREAFAIVVAQSRDQPKYTTLKESAEAALVQLDRNGTHQQDTTTYGV